MSFKIFVMMFLMTSLVSSAPYGYEVTTEAPQLPPPETTTLTLLPLSELNRPAQLETTSYGYSVSTTMETTTDTTSETTTETTPETTTIQVIPKVSMFTSSYNYESSTMETTTEMVTPPSVSETLNMPVEVSTMGYGKRDASKKFTLIPKKTHVFGQNLPTGASDMSVSKKVETPVHTNHADQPTHNHSTQKSPVHLSSSTHSTNPVKHSTQKMPQHLSLSNHQASLSVSSSNQLARQF